MKFHAMCLNYPLKALQWIQDNGSVIEAELISWNQNADDSGDGVANVEPSDANAASNPSQQNDFKEIFEVEYKQFCKFYSSQRLLASLT